LRAGQRDILLIGSHQLLNILPPVMTARTGGQGSATSAKGIGQKGLDYQFSASRKFNGIFFARS